MTASHPWHIWQGRGWPTNAHDEEQFITALRHRAGRAPRGSFARASAVMVITALRCGTDADALLTQGPGLQPAKLVASYDRLEALRAAAADAWHTIVTDPRPETLAAHYQQAAALLPVPLSRLAIAIADVPEQAGWLVASVDEKVRQLQDTCDHIYTQLEQHTSAGRHEDAIELGTRLFDPTTGNYLFAETYFLPRRVGELSPLRIIDLLGERRDDPKLL